MLLFLVDVSLSPFLSLKVMKQRPQVRMSKTTKAEVWTQPKGYSLTTGNLDQGSKMPETCKNVGGYWKPQEPGNKQVTEVRPLSYSCGTSQTSRTIYFL